MKTYQSTVRKFRNNPDFKDFQDSPYAPPKAENEMKQVFKDIVSTDFMNIAVLTQKYF